MKNLGQLFLAVVLVFGVSNSCQAIGLGKIKLYSFLNEPLSAEIEILSPGDLDDKTLISELASSKDFVRAGMARPFFLTRLKFEVVKHDTTVVIYVSSTKPVKHPFLDFLVELSWPDGKLVKGYTVLIDPAPLIDKLADREIPISKKKPKKISRFENDFIDEPVVLESEVNLEQELVLAKNILEDIAVEDIIEEIPEEIVDKTKTKTKTKIKIEETDLFEQKLVKPIATTPVLEEFQEDLVPDTIAPETIVPETIPAEEPKSTEILSGVISFLKNKTTSSQLGINAQELISHKKAMSKEVLPEFVEDDFQQLKEQVEKPEIEIKSESESESEFESKNIPDKEIFLYEKYGKELLFSLFMVMISLFAVVKILKRSQTKKQKELTTEEEDYVEEEDCMEMEASDVSEIKENIELEAADNFDEEFTEDFEEIVELEGLQDVSMLEAEESDNKNNKNIAVNNKEEPVEELFTEEDLPDDIAESLSFLSSDEDKDEDEVKLKLDLVQQYLEAGDKTSAKDVLEELSDVSDSNSKAKINDLKKELEELA